MRGLTMYLHNKILRLLAPSGRRARLMIFTYHRVPHRKDLLLPNEPSSEEFERHVAMVRKYFNPIRLTDVPELLTRDALPDRAVCVTLDDGYENNLTVAGPVLKKYGVPATVFVAVEPVVSGIMWNDLVIETIREAEHQLDLSVENLGVHNLADTKAKLLLVDELLGRLKYLEPAQRWSLSSGMYERTSGKNFPRLMLRPEQLHELHQYGIEVGAHTMTHPILSKLSDIDAEEEIGASRSWLNDLLQRDTESFAYPNGRPGIDYSAKHVDMVASSGFKVAVSTVWGCATRVSSLFELPRFTPWEYQDSAFVGRVEKTLLRSYWPFRP